MLKRMVLIINLHIQKLLREIEQLDLAIKQYSKYNYIDKYDLATGRKFNELIDRFPICEEELLSISETVCKFVGMTRKTNIDEYLFEDKELKHPRIFNNSYVKILREKIATLEEQINKTIKE